MFSDKAKHGEVLSGLECYSPIEIISEGMAFARRKVAGK